MSKNKYELRQSRISTEVRFRPNLTYFDDVFKKASQLEEEFEDWQTSHSPLQAILYSVELKELLNLGSDRIIYITEDNDDFEVVKDKLDRYYKIFLTDSNIETVRRIGARQIFLIETSCKFDFLSNRLYENFNSNKDELRDIAIDSVNDFAYVIDGVKDGFKNHLRFGPVKAAEGVKRFNSAFKNKIKLTSEGNIFIDIDIYTEAQKDLDDLSEDMNEILKQLDEITKKISKLIKGSLND